MVRHDFKVKTEWLGGREEVGKLRGDIINENISIPFTSVAKEKAQIQMNY